MTPPAKKAVPSLSDLTKKNSTSEVEENNTPEVEGDRNNKPVLEPASKSSELTTSDENDAKTEKEENNSDDSTPPLSENVVSTVPNKTPAELAAETPDESAARYGIDRTITDEDDKNPRVEASHENLFPQIPSGTHLHPDIAKSTQNRGIGTTTENASFSQAVVGYDYAEEAPIDDKGIKNSNVNDVVDGRHDASS